MPAANHFARLFEDIPDDLRHEASREALRDAQTRSLGAAYLADSDVSPQAGTAAVMLVLTRARVGLPDGFDDEAIQSVAIVDRHLATLPDDKRDNKLHEHAGGFMEARGD